MFHATRVGRRLSEESPGVRETETETNDISDPERGTNKHTKQGYKRRGLINPKYLS